VDPGFAAIEADEAGELARAVRGLAGKFWRDATARTITAMIPTSVASGRDEGTRRNQGTPGRVPR